MMTKILIADDHGVMRDGLRSLLDAHPNFRVVAAVANGADAVRETMRLAPKVVIMDVLMPHMNGIDATRAILDAAPTTKVLMLSARTSSNYVEEALGAGARGFVGKSSTAQELVKAVRLVASGKRYLGEGIAKPSTFPAVGRKAAPAGIRLTARERDLLRLIGEGQSNMEMADALGLSTRTVETYRIRMMQKLDIHNLASLVKFAIRHGFTSL